MNAIDEEETREVLRAATGEDPSEESVRTLHRTIADETAELITESSRKARRGGRAVGGDDVGREADRRYPAHAGMAEVRAHPEVRESAFGAIDEDETRGMFRTASGEAPDDEAVMGVREAIADEIAMLALAADGRARRRGRAMEGDDVARAAEERYQERYEPMQSYYFRD